MIKDSHCNQESNVAIAALLEFREDFQSNDNVTYAAQQLLKFRAITVVCQLIATAGSYRLV